MMLHHKRYCYSITRYPLRLLMDSFKTAIRELIMERWDMFNERQHTATNGDAGSSTTSTVKAEPTPPATTNGHSQPAANSPSPSKTPSKTPSNAQEDTEEGQG